MRDLIVTALEAVCLVLAVLAVAVYLWRFDPALGLGGAAVAALGESLIVAALAPKGDAE